MKNFFTKIIDLIPGAILLILICIVLITLLVHGFTYDHVIGLINVLVWPTVTFCALIFFRKVFTYLFLSMDEFNFFGNRGQLQDVRQIITKKANELREYEKNQEKLESERVEHKKELDNIRNVRDKSISITERMGNFAEKLIKENDNLKLLNIDLSKKIENLSMIQRQFPSNPETSIDSNREEIKDIGLTNPLSENSEKK